VSKITKELELKREEVVLAEVHLQKTYLARFTWSVRIVLLVVIALVAWVTIAAWARGMEWLGLAS
jgi:hypothetical protein